MFKLLLLESLPVSRDAETDSVACVGGVEVHALRRTAEVDVAFPTAAAQYPAHSLIRPQPDYS